jgi:hypothetical protein
MAPAGLMAIRVVKAHTATPNRILGLRVGMVLSLESPQDRARGVESGLGTLARLDEKWQKVCRAFPSSTTGK